MKTATLRRWSWAHKWSSLLCTPFILLLCLTGLPLIFSHEIEQFIGEKISIPNHTLEKPKASLDEIVQRVANDYPDKVPLYFFAEEDNPDIWYIKLDTHANSDERNALLITVNAHTGETLAIPDFGQGFMGVVYRLHVDLYAGLVGKLFLGAMGLLLSIAVISGIVLYTPFMRKLTFGTVRNQYQPRTRWLDIHNLIGVVTIIWVLVVGLTGVINTWADLLLKEWQREQIHALQTGKTRLIDTANAPAINGSLQQAIDRLLSVAPNMHISMIAYPNTLRATPEHFAVILRGDTPLTARLTQSLLINPLEGKVFEASPRPWYITALQLSEPLHFGDYGGLPLKVLWALLDISLLIITVSGLYLFLKRKNQKKYFP